MYVKYSSTCAAMQGLGLLRASEEGEEATVTSLLHSGVDPNFTHTVREREKFRTVVTVLTDSHAYNCKF